MVCSLCESKSLVFFIETKDYSFSKEKFSLCLCSVCGVLITKPFPKKISEYYDKKNYLSYKKKNSFFGKVYSLVQKANNELKFRFLKGYNKKSLLDFGAGSGNFLKEAKKRGFLAYGYEPINATSNDYVFDDLKTIPAQDFDIITLWHVLEHTKNPLFILQKLKKRLNKNGLICVAVPNRDSFDASYYGKVWAGYDVPRHLYHFNEKSFLFLLKRAGLTLLEKKPLFFDSFYISMISEKNKKNPFWVVKGFLVGLLSNIFALYNKKYSSIIYIISR